MPRIAPEDLTPVTEFKVRLRLDVQAKINAYGRYLNPSEPSSATYVITESLNAIFAGDKEFSEFWKKHQAEFLTPVSSGKFATKRGRPAVAKTTA